jgi:Na+/melibiose symporter-like transporter
MSAQELVLAVALGGAVIAVWLDVRLESRAPSTATWIAVHLVGAMLALQLMAPLVTLMVAGSDQPARRMAALLLVVLPAFTYISLSAIWLLKLIRRAAQPRL